jgi:transcriptional regulator with XRE-family HTH domain
MRPDPAQQAEAPALKTTCQKIREARKKLRWSQRDFAAALDMSQAYLCEIETGSKEPSLNLLRLIAAGCRLHVTQLIGEPLTPVVLPHGFIRPKPKPSLLSPGIQVHERFRNRLGG